MSYALSYDSSSYSEVVINTPHCLVNNCSNIHKNLMNHSHHMHERGLDHSRTQKKLEKKIVKTAPHHWIESVEKHFSLFKF